MTLHSTAVTADMAGVRERTLLQWASDGVIRPAIRTAGKVYWSDQNVRTVRVLNAMRPTVRRLEVLAVAAAALEHAKWENQMLVWSTEPIAAHVVDEAEFCDFAYWEPRCWSVLHLEPFTRTDLTNCVISGTV